LLGTSLVDTDRQAALNGSFTCLDFADLEAKLQQFAGGLGIGMSPYQ
jgi:hypothetical protein